MMSKKGKKLCIISCVIGMVVIGSLLIGGMIYVSAQDIKENARITKYCQENGYDGFESLFGVYQCFKEITDTTGIGIAYKREYSNRFHDIPETKSEPTVYVVYH